MKKNIKLGMLIAFLGCVMTMDLSAASDKSKILTSEEIQTILGEKSNQKFITLTINSKNLFYLKTYWSVFSSKQGTIQNNGKTIVTQGIRSNISSYYALQGNSSHPQYKIPMNASSRCIELITHYKKPLYSIVCINPTALVTAYSISLEGGVITVKNENNEIINTDRKEQTTQDISFYSDIKQIVDTLTPMKPDDSDLQAIENTDPKLMVSDSSAAPQTNTAPTPITKS